MRIQRKDFGRRKWTKSSVFAAVLPLAGLSIGAVPLFAASASQNIRVASIIEELRRQIPQRMSAEGIPGFAVAVVDEQKILWVEGFGYTDWDRKFSVTTDTAFSIQSMSKSFTTTATLFAVQDGLVDLDTPISAYLPDFHVNSVFEESPERHITLRMLLSHTAGLAHEAAVGNNYDFPYRSFEEHIASITNTWLKFPVGRRYSYSNLGIDVVGYVLQVRSGKSFPDYVKAKVLVPLGMRHSTVSIPEIFAKHDRAIGHRGPLRPPVGWLIIPSGGIWASANDMARFIRFHINRGALDGASLLRVDLVETMYTSPNEASRRANYALGIYRVSKNGARLFQHGGGGFGFNCSMIWYPELKLGAVALSNKEHRRLCFDLPGEILDAIIAAQPEAYAERAKAKPVVRPALASPSPETPLSDSRLAELLASRGLSADAAAFERWKKYCGTYVWTTWGIPEASARISERHGHLCLDEARLTEVLPGLFLTPAGDSLDFRGREPSVRNVRVVKVNNEVLLLRISLYAVCGLLFISSLCIGPVRWFLHRRRESAGTVGVALRWSCVLAALAAGFSLVCLALITLVPNLVYVPWPASRRELYPPGLGVVMTLPYANLVLAGGAVLLMAAAWGKDDRTRAVRIHQVLVTIALLAFNLVVLT